jgi:hypothetical protein
MFLTVHAAAGVIVGIQTGNPIIAFFAGLVSHFVLDMIPHGDQDLVEGNDTFSDKEKKLLHKVGNIDTVIMLAELAVLYSTGLMPLTFSVAAALVGALLPDFLNALYILYDVKILHRYFCFQRDIHYMWKGFTINLKQGLFVQSIFLIGFLYVLIRL